MITQIFCANCCKHSWIIVSLQVGDVSPALVTCVFAFDDALKPSEADIGLRDA